MPIAFSLALELYNVWMKMIVDALWAVSGSAATSLCCSMECRWEGSALTAGTALSKSFVSMQCRHILADCMLGSLPRSCRAQAIRDRPRQRQCTFVGPCGDSIKFVLSHRPARPSPNPRDPDSFHVPFIHFFVDLEREPSATDLLC